MASTLPLNLDILRQIAWSSDRQTCAALIQSCRFFYQEAAKRVLHDFVNLSYPRDVGKFVRFLGPQPHARARHVRELRIGVSRLSLKDLRALEGSIAQMDRLESLWIDEGEELFEFCPSLLETLAGLTSLRRLRVCSAGELTWIFLKALKSDLISISLNWMGSDENWFAEQGLDDDDWAVFHPVPVLAKWRSTLEELTCESWFTASDLPVFTDVYPNMRRLTIERDDFPLVAPYIRAYPNLACLSVQTDHVEDIRYPEDVERLHQHRALNIGSQQAVGGPGTWQHLGEYVGSLVDLYLLGPICHISRIAFTTQMTDRHLELLSAVLSCAQPRHLKLEGDVSLLGHSTHSLPTILLGPASSRLESLVLNVDLKTEGTPLDAGAALTALASTLAKLPLCRLRLRVFQHHSRPPQRWPGDFSESDDSESESESAQTRAARNDTRAHVQDTPQDSELDIDAFMSVLPSLTDAVVEFTSTRKSGHRERTIVPERADLPGGCDPRMFEI
ncbi:hypothetical protein K466DRAFT_655684 [Polyporus arcularius HHB13444]|uniref:F-box domain-containing protein n=1 Tax=Polyporus arcularius HHB13444 TaxID=1314778 RepID=A0A5C3P111_9APHY|nr:hypothetical protein K466DRAFT_655684 [Polyporus arcularius HHB13444]